ncbi:MAG: PRC-barrel domain protein [Hyphomicrobiales bacterium]|nr:PRC-barrel domain protein [Hyphomicrobiales bacterium]
MLRNISAAALALALGGGLATAQTAPQNSPMDTPAMTPSPNYPAQQSGSQAMASSYINKNVYDAREEKIGSINDLLIDPSNGKVTAAVIGVGGFIGIGEKNVAVPFQNVKISLKDNREWLVVNTTKEELQSAPDFKRRAAQQLVRSTDILAPAATPSSATPQRMAASETPPLEGANSFTEAQARSRIEASGFSDVQNLAKDEKSIWRGMASKDGKSVRVALDFKGNVVSE